MFRLLAFSILSVNFALSASPGSKLLTIPRAVPTHGCGANCKMVAKSDSSLLAIRGGGSDNQLINAMGYLLIYTGMQGWLFPKKQIADYGVEDISEEEKCFLRCLSSMNVLVGVTLMAGESEAVSLFLTGWALATTANVAALERLDVPKGPILGSIAVFATLGELARHGKLNAGLAGNILAFLLIPVSVAEIVAPKPTMDAFGIPSPSSLTKSLFENFSFAKISIGLYLLIGKLTGKRGFGFAAFMASNAVNVAKTMTRSKEVGLKMPGLIIWGVLSTAGAIFAYMKEKA